MELDASDRLASSMRPSGRRIGSAITTHMLLHATGVGLDPLLPPLLPDDVCRTRVGLVWAGWWSWVPAARCGWTLFHGVGRLRQRVQCLV